MQCWIANGQFSRVKNKFIIIYLYLPSPSLLIYFCCKLIIVPFLQDDFSESSEVSTYLDGISSVETSQSNLTETQLAGSAVPSGSAGAAIGANIPEVVVTQEFVTGYGSQSPHQKLIATYSAPPTFTPLHHHFSAPSPASATTSPPTITTNVTDEDRTNTDNGSCSKVLKPLKKS